MEGVEGGAGGEVGEGSGFLGLNGAWGGGQGARSTARLAGMCLAQRGRCRESAFLESFTFDG